MSHKVLNALERLDRKVESSDILFSDNSKELIYGIDSFIRIKDEEVIGNLEIMGLNKENTLFIYKIDDYVDIAPQFYSDRDRLINVVEGELIVELYDVNTAKFLQRIKLNKSHPKFVVEANIGHHIYTDIDTMCVMSFEPPKVRNRRVISMNEKAKILLEKANSRNIITLKTQITGEEVLITDISENISLLGFNRLDMIGKSVFDYVDLTNKEDMLNDIMTHGSVIKTAVVNVPFMKPITVLGFIYHLGNGEIIEYLIRTC